jgi:predicted metal-dependent phosphoesterase TrpH
MPHLAVDLHIHSALSPCADDDMTPCNIANMAYLKGLDAIAVTDHNACDNVAAVIEAAADRLIVIPGMELTTEEEVHLLAYFRTLPDILSFSAALGKRLPDTPNSPEFFGHQWILDAEDNVVGERPDLLIGAADLSLEEAVALIRAHSGTAVPAHVDRESFSVLSQLGFMPRHLPFSAIEVSRGGLNPLGDQWRVLRSSDAHRLGDILEREFFIDPAEKNAGSILDWIEEKHT